MLSEPDTQTDYSDLLMGDFNENAPEKFTDVILSARRIAVMSLIPEASEATGVNADTLRGMWWVESRSGHPDMMVSPTGAKGDWQFTKETQANMFLQHGPKIAQNLEESGFLAEAEQMRFLTRGLRNLAIEKYDIAAGNLALDQTESDELFQGRSLSWSGDIAPVNTTFFANPDSYETFDATSMTSAFNTANTVPATSFTEMIDETRLNLPATMTFTAAYYIKDIAEQAGVDASDYDNAGALYAGYNIGPGNAARLAGELADTPNAMAAIGSAAEKNPAFFGNNATGTEALANYQSSVDGWRDFELYRLAPTPALVESISGGLREHGLETDINPYDIYNNVLEDRGFYERADFIHRNRDLPADDVMKYAGMPVGNLDRVIQEVMENPFDTTIDPEHYILSADQKALLVLNEPTEEGFAPIP